MLNQNKLITGIILGLAFPIITFLFLYNIFNLLELQGLASAKGLSPDFRRRTIAILAIAVNLVLLNLYRRTRRDQAMRGVVIATTALAVAWVIVFGLRML